MYSSLQYVVYKYTHVVSHAEAIRCSCTIYIFPFITPITNLINAFKWAHTTWVQM